MTHTCRYTWVRTWYRCGFDECRECGRTRAYGERPETFEEAAQAVAAEHSEALGMLAKTDFHPDAIALTMEPAKPLRKKRPVLSDRDLTILKWRDEQDASYEEIGRRSGLELGHVYRIVSRARSLLGAKVPNDQASNDLVKP